MEEGLGGWEVGEDAEHGEDVGMGGWADGRMGVRMGGREDGEEGGRLAGRLAGSRDPPPGGQKVTKNP